MKRIIFALIGAAMLGVTLPSVVTAKEIVLRAVSFLPIHIGTNGLHVKEFIKRVNEEMSGVLRIDLLGGSEAIAYPDQPNAVRTGAIDMGFMSGSQIYTLVPINDYWTVTSLSPGERRENGIYERFNEVFNDRMNAHMIGEHLFPVQGSLYFGKLSEANLAKIKAGDFKGLRMRGGASYKSLMDGLGIERFPISPADIYTAVERGTVDGYAWVTIDLVSQGWTDITKYRIDVVYNHATAAAYINLDKWNSLTEEQRKIITRIGKEWETWSDAQAVVVVAKELKDQVDKGIELISIPADRKVELLKFASEGLWKSFKEKLPDFYAAALPLEPRDRNTFVPKE